eukprot:364268-Chlamydomonas_euryale.AAC.11
MPCSKGAGAGKRARGRARTHVHVCARRQAAADAPSCPRAPCGLSGAGRTQRPAARRSALRGRRWGCRGRAPPRPSPPTPEIGRRGRASGRGRAAPAQCRRAARRMALCG